MYLTPLRYPGGKTQLYNFIEQIIKDNHYNNTFYELCAGGANLSLSLLANKVVKKVLINDYDKSIYSVFYNACFHATEFIEKIYQVPFDYNDSYQDSFLTYYKKVRQHYIDNVANYNNKDINLAFETLFLNRTNFSGIINSKPIGGDKQVNIN